MVTPDLSDHRDTQVHIQRQDVDIWGTSINEELTLILQYKK